MKKIISAALTAAMLLTVLCVGVFAANDSVTFKFSEMGYSNEQKVEKIEKDGITIELSLGTNDKNNYPAYYDKGAALRIYKNNTFTVKSEKAITSIKFTFLSDYAAEYKPDNGTVKLEGLTATWTGNSKSIKFENPDHATRVPEMVFSFGSSSSGQSQQSDLDTPEKIVNALYSLGNGEKLAGGPYTLEGVIKQVDTAYNTQFSNITVTMIVGDMTDKPVQCYRLGGEGADKLDVGDTIKVQGELKNYYNSNRNTNTYEFDQGCSLLSYKKAAVVEPDPVYNTAKELVDAAYALKKGEVMRGTHTLTGKIIRIDTPYSSQFGNISVTIVAEGLEDKPMYCYRLVNGKDVDYVDKLAVGDTITVTGKIKNYDDGSSENGVVEFDQNTTLDSYTVGEHSGEQGGDDLPKTDAEIIEALYALKDSETLNGPFTLKGTISNIDTEYNSQYENITVTIKVKGFDDKPVMCYRLKGEGADRLETGDTITVTGNFKNYKGTFEFVEGCTLDKVEKGSASNPSTSEAPVAIAVFAAVMAVSCAACVIGKRITVSK